MRNRREELVIRALQQEIEEVKEYIYLGQATKLDKS